MAPMDVVVPAPLLLKMPWLTKLGWVPPKFINTMSASSRALNVPRLSNTAPGAALADEWNSQVLPLKLVVPLLASVRLVPNLFRPAPLTFRLAPAAIVSVPAPPMSPPVHVNSSFTAKLKLLAGPRSAPPLSVSFWIEISWSRLTIPPPITASYVSPPLPLFGNSGDDQWADVQLFVELSHVDTTSAANVADDNS